MANGHLQYGAPLQSPESPYILAIWDYSAPFSEPDIFNGLLVVHMVRFEVAVGHKKMTIFPPLSIKS
jgi:hypothetical protein